MDMETCGLVSVVVIWWPVRFLCNVSERTTCMVLSYVQICNTCKISKILVILYIALAVVMGN